MLELIRHFHKLQYWVILCQTTFPLHQRDFARKLWKIAKLSQIPWKSCEYFSSNVYLFFTTKLPNNAEEVTTEREEKIIGKLHNVQRNNYEVQLLLKMIINVIIFNSTLFLCPYSSVCLFYSLPRLTYKPCFSWSVSLSISAVGVYCAFFGQQFVGSALNFFLILHCSTAQHFILMPYGNAFNELGIRNFWGWELKFCIVCCNVIKFVGFAEYQLSRVFFI